MAHCRAPVPVLPVGIQSLRRDLDGACYLIISFIRASGVGPRRGQDATARSDQPAKGRYKRFYDLLMVAVFSVLFLPIWVPAWIIVPLLILVIDGRPIFYTQDRLGKDGRVFRIFKFRTMPRDMDKATGPTLPAPRDSRATRLGQILRVTSLDEAPQVVNILRGEMSIVGPRPEHPELAEFIKKTVPDYDLRLRTRPGIAGLDHVRGNFNYRKRLRYDNFYIERMSPRFDLVIMAWSVWAIAKRLKSPPR